MKFKKMAATLLAATMSVSVVACGEVTAETATVAPAATTETKQEPAAEKPEEVTSEHVDMTVILRGGSYADVIKKALPTFEEAHDCSVEVLEMSFDDLHTGIALDSVNATGTYDLCMVDGSWMAEFTQNNVLANLSDMGYAFDADIIPNTTAICKVDGDIYLAPYFGNVTVMLYNKANLEAAGYNSEEVVTLEDLLNIAKSSKEQGKFGFAYRGDTGDNIVSDFLPVLLAHGGWVVDENNQPTVNSEEFVNAVNYYVDLIETGSAMSKDDVTASIDNGAATLAIGWPGWYVPSADSAASYTVIPSKENDSAAGYNTSEYGTWTIGIPSNSPHPDLALELLEYIMDPQVQLESIANGGVPCRYSCLQNEDILKDYPHLAIVCAALENGVYRPTIAEWTEFTNILGAEMGNIFAGAKSVEDGLNDAQEQLENLMK